MNNTIYPCLWFNGNAKEAAAFYSTVFSQTRITAENPLVVQFEATGQKFMCLNGGPQFSFNPSVSFFVQCSSEEELNAAWEKLAESGAVLMPLDTYDWSEKYGWVQDRFGVSWQLSLRPIEAIPQKFIPVLMFTGPQQGHAEEAIRYYTSVFPGSEVLHISRYTKDDPDTEETIKHAQFRLGGQAFMAMDSSYSHGFAFNEAISFVVDCKTQEDIDYYWGKLTEGGSEGQCGWLKDRFGVSWQIVPVVLGRLMSDPERSPRVMQAFMKMKKFDIETLENA